MAEEVRRITVGAPDARRDIAVLAAEGAGPPVLWLGGFGSDMRGTKAEALADWGRRHGRAMVRFDYSGHGESGGAFEAGTISRWLEEAEAVFERFCGAGAVVVGSSLGGWLALRLAQRRFARPGDAGGLAGLVLIAPAPDFTEALVFDRLTPEQREALRATGRIEEPSPYGPPTVYTRALIEDGRSHLVLGGEIRLGCPVAILQGRNDAEVPWRHALSLAEHIAGDDVTFTLVEDGDHRLSRPADIDLILAAVERVAG